MAILCTPSALAFAPHTPLAPRVPTVVVEPAAQSTLFTTVPRTTKSTQLSAVAESQLALAALAGCVSGGFFSGALHAVAGTFHGVLLPLWRNEMIKERWMDDKGEMETEPLW